MTRTDREITKVSGVSANFLVQYTKEDSSLDLLRDHVILPRIKVIQGMTKQELKDIFGEGSAIIRPGDALVAKKGEAFSFVPQFFFPEFCKWADRRDDEGQMILDRSLDPMSEIAKRARNAELRSEVYPEDANKPADKQKRFRYVEHLNFPGVIYGKSDLAGTAVVLSFSKGEFATGSNFIQAIRLRRETIEVDGQPVSMKVPLWAQVWSFTPALRQKGEKKWWGLSFVPAETSVISPSEAPGFQASFEELKELHRMKKLGTDYEDPDEAPSHDTDNAEF